jgi:hypothetical protein
MSGSERDDRAALALCEEVYGRLLEDVRDFSDRVLDRLRGLGNELPAGLVEQVERLRGGPSRDRRAAVRVPDGPVPVGVRVPGLPEGGAPPALKDRSPTGLALLLPCPAHVGAVLRVRLPPELGGWVAAEVRHCRREGRGWVAGCELLCHCPDR